MEPRQAVHSSWVEIERTRMHILATRAAIQRSFEALARLEAITASMGLPASAASAAPPAQKSEPQ